MAGRRARVRCDETHLPLTMHVRGCSMRDGQGTSCPVRDGLSPSVCQAQWKTIMTQALTQRKRGNSAGTAAWAHTPAHTGNPFQAYIYSLTPSCVRTIDPLAFIAPVVFFNLEPRSLASAYSSRSTIVTRDIPV